ncbi:right-handed parallel beta-helix repeat-containing protein [Massilia sp. TS11]|uniref:right-handed parallel beta-helix repeat-containing protein n=1 Tax=Massilia sp. TS11 TaxID=2908003 RepID=UPI001EDA069F|nr:right-handed parallel beta-helix repeat-containing protein [Massilia sp. TS11]MCG2583055.1 right-handed parallel beta-helix repeat-containing protein [Massilia sp. TS11]
MFRLLCTIVLGLALPAQAAVYVVAPQGRDGAAGTLTDPWASIAYAQSQAEPGDTIYFRGGRYVYTVATSACASRRAIVSGVDLNKSGREGQPIRYWAYPGETPVFDFSGMRDDCRVKGFNVVADWLHLKGLEITGAPQQPENRLNHESWGVWVKGSHNVFELLNLHHNMGPGLFLKDGAYNLVLNSDSHHNYDPYTSNGAGQSADGFGAHVGVNQPGNVFRGCRAWANTDDGFDLINAYSTVIIEDSWAWQHGYLPGTHTPLPDGNGNGFKAGGYGGKYVPNGVPHIVRRVIAFDNKVNGLYANHHPVDVEFSDNIAFDNGRDLNMLGIAPDGSAREVGVVRNQCSGARYRLSAAWEGPRQPDGSLPRLAVCGASQ